MGGEEEEEGRVRDSVGRRKRRSRGSGLGLRFRLVRAVVSLLPFRELVWGEEKFINQAVEREETRTDFASTFPFESTQDEGLFRDIPLEQREEDEEDSGG